MIIKSKITIVHTNVLFSIYCCIHLFPYFCLKVYFNKEIQWALNSFVVSTRTLSFAMHRSIYAQEVIYIMDRQVIKYLLLYNVYNCLSDMT